MSASESSSRDETVAESASVAESPTTSDQREEVVLVAEYGRLIALHGGASEEARKFRKLHASAFDENEQLRELSQIANDIYHHAMAASSSKLRRQRRIFVYIVVGLVALFVLLLVAAFIAFRGWWTANEFQLIVGGEPLGHVTKDAERDRLYFEAIELMAQHHPPTEKPGEWSAYYLVQWVRAANFRFYAAKSAGDDRAENRWRMEALDRIKSTRQLKGPQLTSFDKLRLKNFEAQLEVDIARKIALYEEALEMASGCDNGETFVLATARNNLAWALLEQVQAGQGGIQELDRALGLGQQAYAEAEACNRKGIRFEVSGVADTIANVADELLKRIPTGPRHDELGDLARKMHRIAGG